MSCKPAPAALQPSWMPTEMDNHKRPRGHARRDASVANDAFRVRTVDDFTGASSRKPRSSTMACQMCRSRKIKCVTSSSRDAASRPSVPSRCIPCTRADLECRWEVMNRRKGLKSRLYNHDAARSQVAVPEEGVIASSGGGLFASKSNGGSGTATTLPPSTTALSMSTNTTRQKRFPSDVPHVEIVQPQSPAPSELQTQDERRDSRAIAQLPFIHDKGYSLDTSSGTFVVSQADFALDTLPGMSPAPSHQADGAGNHANRAQISSWSNEHIPGLQDWPDLQNFVLGLEYEDVFRYPEYLNHEPGTAQAEPKRPMPPVPGMIRLRYYRRFGPTAVAPGLQRLSVIVGPSDNSCSALPMDETPGSEAAISFGDAASPASTISNQSLMFDKAARLPHPDIIPQILDTFFQYFGGYFPFLNPEILGGHVRTGEASTFLLNAIAALTIRFCHLDGALACLNDKYEHPWQRASPFLKKAKTQLIPVLSIPAPEVVAGLLILAWADFGDNNETGLWMFVGMAIRMAQDLGLHRAPDTTADSLTSFHDHACPSPDGSYILTDEQSAIHQQKARLVMFWSVFIMDVCISLGTGRPPTIRRSEIEVPIPTTADMKIAQLDFCENVSTGNSVFPETVRMMLHFSEAVEALNQRIPNPSQSPQASSSSASRKGHLAELKQTLLRSYNLLPPNLAFSVDSYKEACLTSQSGLFLMLHLFFYTLMILLSESLSKDAKALYSQSQTRRSSMHNASAFLVHDVNHTSSMREPGLTMITLQKMVQVMTTVDLIDNRGYLASPFVSHCLFMAASMLLKDTQLRRPAQQDTQMEAAPLNADDGEIPRFSGNTIHHHQSIENGLWASFIATDYQLLRKKLQSQAEYFAAVNFLISTLDQKEKGVVDNDDGEGAVAVNDTPSRCIDGMDPGIVTRYAIPPRSESYLPVR